jgi:multiple sugar transport system permease protein
MTIAALQAVPVEIEEAARVDGAGRFRTAWSIQLPMIMPVTMVTIIVLTFSYLNTAALILDLTGGGPVGSSEVLSLRLFRQVFNSINVGRASVLSVLLIGTNMILAACYYWALNWDRRFQAR